MDICGGPRYVSGGGAESDFHNEYQRKLPLIPNTITELVIKIRMSVDHLYLVSELIVLRISSVLCDSGPTLNIVQLKLFEDIT